MTTSTSTTTTPSTDLASDRFGLPAAEPFTGTTAADYGVTPNVLTRLLRDGVLRRVFRGVYVDNAVPDTLALRTRAVALAVPTDAVLTDTTAAWLYGLDLQPPGAHRQTPIVHDFRPPGRTRVRQPAVIGGERTLADSDIQIVNGIRATTPLRTACDLGRLLGRDRAIGALDALLGLDAFTQPELIAAIRRFGGYRGVVQLRELAPIADPRSESMTESTLRLRWIDEGLPFPELQIPVSIPGAWWSYRLDLGIRRIRYAAEYDGDDWHSTPEQIVHDNRRRAELRDDGWIIDVFGREQLYARGANIVGNRIRTGLQRAGAPV